MVGVVILVVDGDAGARREAAAALEGPGWEVREFSSAREMLARADLSCPGCVVSGFATADLGGMELLRRLGAAGCRMPVVFLLGGEGLAAAVEAMRRGALTVLEKPADAAALREWAVRGAALSLSRRDEEARGGELARRYRTLTGRESQISGMIAMGMPNKAIARRLGISVTTVRTHRSSLFAKLGVKSAAGLAGLLAGLGEAVPMPVMGMPAATPGQGY